jgi:hypothetical protein
MFFSLNFDCIKTVLFSDTYHVDFYHRYHSGFNGRRADDAFHYADGLASAEGKAPDILTRKSPIGQPH